MFEFLQKVKSQLLHQRFSFKTQTFVSDRGHSGSPVPLLSPFFPILDQSDNHTRFLLNSSSRTFSKDIPLEKVICPRGTQSWLYK